MYPPPEGQDLTEEQAREIDDTFLAPLGMRFPLTTPPGGGEVRREAGIGFRDCFQILYIDHANRSSGHVVDS